MLSRVLKLSSSTHIFRFCSLSKVTSASVIPCRVYRNLRHHLTCHPYSLVHVTRTDTPAINPKKHCIRWSMSCVQTPQWSSQSTICIRWSIHGTCTDIQALYPKYHLHALVHVTCSLLLRWICHTCCAVLHMLLQCLKKVLISRANNRNLHFSLLFIGIRKFIPNALSLHALRKS